MEAQKIADYIAANFKNKVEFADWQGVHKSQVSLWIRKGYIVRGGVMYAPKRDIIKK